MKTSTKIWGLVLICLVVVGFIGGVVFKSIMLILSCLLFIPIGVLGMWGLNRNDKYIQKEIEQHRENGQLVSVSCVMGHNDVVSGWVSGSPNSANGVSVNFSIKNWSEKTIKYYVVYFVPYNAVGDPERCSVCHKSERGVRGVGPIPPLKSDSYRLFENAWYNSLIRSVRATKAEIEYMDGTTATVKL